MNERVSAYLVEVAPSAGLPAPDHGPFTSAGSVRKLELCNGTFSERDAQGRALASVPREYPGVTPEQAWPSAVELEADAALDSRLRWMALEALVRRMDEVQDAHLLVVAWRLAHALGVLG